MKHSDYYAQMIICGGGSNESGGGGGGTPGQAATIQVGTVTTGEPGTDASVTNSGTSSAAVFDFVIPRGDAGERGERLFYADVTAFNEDFTTCNLSGIYEDNEKQIPATEVLPGDTLAEIMMENNRYPVVSVADGVATLGVMYDIRAIGGMSGAGIVWADATPEFVDGLYKIARENITTGNPVAGGVLRVQTDPTTEYRISNPYTPDGTIEMDMAYSIKGADGGGGSTGSDGMELVSVPLYGMESASGLQHAVFSSSDFGTPTASGSGAPGSFYPMTGTGQSALVYVPDSSHISAETMKFNTFPVNVAVRCEIESLDYAGAYGVLSGSGHWTHDDGSGKDVLNINFSPAWLTTDPDGSSTYNVVFLSNFSTTVEIEPAA